MEPRYEHKRSEGLRRVANHPASRLIEEEEVMDEEESEIAAAIARARC